MNTNFEFCIGNDEAEHQRFRYKSMMNVLRRAFSFRRRNRNRPHTGREIEDEIELSSNSVNISNSSTTHSQQSSPSPISSEIASTSRDSLTFADVLSVYEDPFLSLASDGNAYIKFYYEFNARAEFRIEDIHQPHVRKSCRVIKIARIRDIYFATYYDLNCPEKLKTWGITRNDVWWSSHANRTNSVNRYACVCINDGSSIRAGFSVVNAEAFVSALRMLGLPKDCSFNRGIPSPPIQRCLIPFIDEDE